MKISVLASGSKGNVSLIKFNNLNILIDLGMSSKYVESKLKELEVNPKSINFVFLTHVHNDHIYGLKTYLKKHNPTLVLSESMYNYLKKIMPIKDYIIIDKFLDINSLNVTTIKLSHDSEEVLGYIFKENHKEIVYITDTGYINVKHHYELSNKDFYVMESNHDIEKFMNGTYPNHLKRRIISDKGHLSNEMTMKYLNKFIGPKTKGIIFIHMSESNNTEEKIINEMDLILKTNENFPNKIVISKQTDKTELIEIW